MDRAAVYEQLADAYDRRGEARQRDVFLALAADAHLAAGKPEQAERMRQKLLLRSPYHLLKPYGSFAEALQSPDVVDYLEDLRHQFPTDAAEKLLESLQGPMAHPAPGEPNAGGPTETLVGGGPSPFAPQGEARRRPAPSPYRPKSDVAAPDRKAEAPALTWAPSVLYAAVLFVTLAWALYVFAGPFLD